MRRAGAVARRSALRCSASACWAHGRPHLRRPLIGVLGVFVLAAFVVWESMTEHPIVPLELLRTPQLLKTYSLELLIGILEGSLFFIPTVLIGAQGLSYAAAGFIAALGALSFVAVIPSAGRASTVSAAATCCSSERS